MSAIVLKSTQGLSHEEWLAYRRMGIGGSDASVVCGVNRWMSSIQLWMEKTGQLPAQEIGAGRSPNGELLAHASREAAYWGTRLEPLVRDEFAYRTGIKVIPVHQIIRSREYPFMLANLDGVCRCPTHGKCVFEAKTASAFKSNEWDDGIVPREYVLQVQHYLCVTGYEGAYIAVLIGGNSFSWIFIKRDEDLITLLVKYEQDFWKHVQDGIPPPLDGSDACTEFVNNLYSNSTPQSKIKLPSSAAGLIQQYVEADKQEDIFKKQKQEAGNLLKEMLGENEIGTIGKSYITWRKVAQERFDSKTLKVEQPELYKKYVRQSSHRRFVVKADEQGTENDKNQELLSQLRKVG